MCASLTFARLRNQLSAWVRNRDPVPSSCSSVQAASTFGPYGLSGSLSPPALILIILLFWSCHCHILKWISDYFKFQLPRGLLIKRIDHIPFIERCSQRLNKIVDNFIEKWLIRVYWNTLPFSNWHELSYSLCFALLSLFNIDCSFLYNATIMWWIKVFISW